MLSWLFAKSRHAQPSTSNKVVKVTSAFSGKNRKAQPSTRRRRRKNNNRVLLFLQDDKCQYFLVVAVILLYWYFFTWRPQKLLDEQLRLNPQDQEDRMYLSDIDKSLEEEYGSALLHDYLNKHHVRRNKQSEPVGATSDIMINQNKTTAALTPNKLKKYIIFESRISGQGEGNKVSGLLAAHLFGYEFNRTVCIKSYPTFLNAFRVKDPKIEKECKLVISNAPRPTIHSSIRHLSYNKRPPDECLAQKQLKSDLRYIHINSNTYPRWPAVPDNFFTTYYTPTDALLEVLPWKEPPTTVVHLRWPDTKMDVRKGLDNQTLDKLGEMLPSDTFLVTNNIELYDRFEKKYGWKNSQWPNITHSALLFDFVTRRHIARFNDVMNLQLWSDWYSILSAKQVYHTHSDFSLSAIHWMNVNSKTIMGVNDDDGKLQLFDSPWKHDGETEPLVKRTNGTLKNCK